jgi:hypothetical protein
MAYTYFAEVAEGRSGSVDQRYQRAYKRVFLVRTDSAGYGPYYAGSHPSLPLVWSVHPEDTLAYCVGFSVDQDQGDPLLWRVTANYAYNADTAVGGGGGGTSGSTGATGNPAIDTQQQGQAPADRVQSPLSRPRDYQISTVAYPEALRGDAAGNAILNSAYDNFLPPAEIQRFGAQITIGLNNATPPSETWMGCVGKLNASTLTILPPGATISLAAKTTRLNSLNAQAVYENGVAYWRWTLNFEFRPSTTSYAGGWVQLGSSWPVLGWKLVLLDAGKRRWDGTRWTPFTDPPGQQPVTQPVLMDGNTNRLAANTKPYYKAWDIYPTVTFPSPL